MSADGAEVFAVDFLFCLTLLGHAVSDRDEGLRWTEAGGKMIAQGTDTICIRVCACYISYYETNVAGSAILPHCAQELASQHAVPSTR